MPYFSTEAINSVRNLDLLTYLRNYEPEELVKICRGNYCTKTHDSLKISNGMWYWFSRGIGGKSALDYLVKVRDYSFTEAVEKILKECDIDNIQKVEYIDKNEDREFELPERASNNYTAIKYLTNRGIDKEIINECINKGLIYQDIDNNVVFVGYDQNNIAKYASIRTTTNRRFMYEAYKSNKAFSFQLANIKESESVHIFESAIDLLSYATLVKMSNKNLNTNLISLSGVYQPPEQIEDTLIPIALNYYLNIHPKTKRIFLHLDNDYTGKKASNALSCVIPKRFEVIDSPPPNGKDYNDFLCYIINKNLDKGER